MTLIWPTENDVRDDNDGGDANKFNASTIGREIIWDDFWAAEAPGYVWEGFTQVSISNLALTLAKGKVAVRGFLVDFTNNAADPVFTCTDNATNRLWVQLTRDGNSKVNGYQLAVTTDNSILADAVVVGNARTNNGDVQEYHPYTGSKNWIVGTFDTSRANTTNQIVLGFRPRLLFLQAGDVNSGDERRFLDGLTAVVQDYGFDTSGGGGDYNDTTQGKFWAAI